MLWLVIYYIFTRTSLESDQQLQNSKHLFVDSVTKVTLLCPEISLIHISLITQYVLIPQDLNDGHSKV